MPGIHPNYNPKFLKKSPKTHIIRENLSLGSILCSLYLGMSNNEVQSVLNKSVKSTIFIFSNYFLFYSFITNTTNPRKMQF